MPMAKLLFQTTEEPVSQIIRAITWAAYSHVDLVLPEGLLGARLGFGVSIVDHSTLHNSREITAEVDCTDIQLEAIIGFAKSQIGKPYDLSAVLGVAVHEDWKEPGAYDCSEFICACFIAGGKKLLNLEFMSRITPRDLCLSPFIRFDKNSPHYPGMCHRKA